MKKTISMVLIIVGLISFIMINTKDKGRGLLGFYSVANIQPSYLTVEMNKEATLSSSLTPSLDKLQNYYY